MGKIGADFAVKNLLFEFRPCLRFGGLPYPATPNLPIKPQDQDQQICTRTMGICVFGVTRAAISVT